MLAAVLALHVSLITQPVYLDDEPPELRAARNILLVYGGAGAGRPRNDRTVDETQALALELVDRLRAGEPFVQLAARYSDDINASDGAVMGLFAPGMLLPTLDAYLFSAEIGAVSEPLLVRDGVQIVQRVEPRAGVRHILLRGSGDDVLRRCREIQARLAAGEDFAELARDVSEDPDTAARGGLIGVYERGRRDRLLKRAVFEAEIGEVVGPVATPLGLHLVQRIPVDDIDVELCENDWVRVRAILFQHELAEGADPATSRTLMESERVAREVYERALAGEDLAELAREFNDDPTGRVRAGDIGWIHRKAPTPPLLAERMFRAPLGELQEPQRTVAGWVLFRRER